jgi:hypothetical protein
MARRILLIAGVLIVFEIAAVGVAAQRWEYLGERAVRDRVDHDSIPVTLARGDFRRIKMTVRGSAIRFYRVVVIYGNGEPDRIEIRQYIPAGGETRVIDLRGGDRVIRRVDFWYEAKSVGRRGSVLKLFGRT